MRRHGGLLSPYLRFAVRGRLVAPYWRARMHAFGRGSILYRPDWVFRPERMAIGDRVWISQGAWFEIGDPALDREGAVLRIGNGAVLRHHVTISAAESVVIEDDVLIAAWTSIYDSDHTMGPVGNPVWYPQRTAPVRIGRGSWIGERVSVLRGADIGQHCIVGAGSVVKGAVPDRSIAVGIPARVVGSTEDMVGTPEDALRRIAR
ncbi:MAG TPA: acyltransferase [Solirubrobacteraceae bacterium]|nr:acyltransferase [Solirubrobacteraceae bacterium]